MARQTLANLETVASRRSKLNAMMAELYAASPTLVEAGELDEIANPIAIYYPWKRLLSSYRGPAIKVRRSVDDATYEFNFKGGYLDTEAMLQWAGTAAVYVVTVYDQSGNANHCTQADATKQPLLLPSGYLSLVEQTMGMSFDAVNDLLVSSPVYFGSQVTTVVTQLSNGGASGCPFSSGSSFGGQAGWNTPILSSGGARVGGFSGGSNFWDVTTPTQRNATGAKYDLTLAQSLQIVPLYNATVGTSGWTNTLTGTVVAPFDIAQINFGNQVGLAAGACNLRGAAVYGRVLTDAEYYTVAKALGTSADIIGMGDSITSIGAYSSLVDRLLKPYEKMQYNGAMTVATSGETMAQQKARWTALPNRRYAKAVLLHIGINSITTSANGAALIAEYQDLVDTIRADNATCKIIAATLTPCYSYWTTVGADTAVQNAKWIALNDAIMQRGSTPITGLDHSFDGHTLALTSGTASTASLAAMYSLDLLHPNELGRQLMGTHARNALIAAGVLP